MTGVIGVSPVFVNCCPLEKWREIYPGLGRKLPVRRMLSTYGQIGMAGSKHRYPNNEPTPPLYNGGALLVPWDLDFGNHWRRNFHVMHDTFGKRSDEWQRITSSDQPSLAVTVEEFRSRNQRIRMLPHSVNVWIPHVSGGEVSCEETIIYHAANIFRNYNIDADIALEYKKMINGTAEREVELRAIYRKLADLTMRHVQPYLGQL